MQDMFIILQRCMLAPWSGNSSQSCVFTRAELAQGSGYLNLAQYVEYDPLASGLEERFEKAS